MSYKFKTWIDWTGRSNVTSLIDLLGLIHGRFARLALVVVKLVS